MKILVSCCLLGEKCRYDGAGRPNGDVINLGKEHTLIPVCPEVLGGLPTPRVPSERRDGMVVSADGRDVTAHFLKGARAALEIAQKEGVQLCVLKSKSPSCGSGEIYDGTFTGTLTAGDGTAAALLKANGFRVISESEIEALKAELNAAQASPKI